MMRFSRARPPREGGHPARTSRNLPGLGGLFFSALATLTIMTGCAHGTRKAGSHHGPWGQGATASPGWSAIGHAAREAAMDPYTWIPAAGALGLQIGHADNHIANWARRERPIFGSTKTASDVSNWLQFSALGTYAILGLNAPDDPADAWSDKGAGFGVGAGAIIGTIGLTLPLKSAVHRLRPNGSDHQSFPSGHTSLVAVNSRLASDVLTSYGLSPNQNFAANAGLFTLTAATGWARIEAGEHHPADVLAGAALGNFLAVFATRAFLRPGPDSTARLQLSLTPAGGVLGFTKTF